MPTAGPRPSCTSFRWGCGSDLHGTGVRVTSIEPGMVETEFTLVRTGGDQSASDAIYGGADPMTGADIAATLLWVAELPPHLNINTLELMPVSQSFAGFQVSRVVTLRNRSTRSCRRSPGRWGSPDCCRSWRWSPCLLGGGPDVRFTALSVGYGYAALIFSFLGGVWWGLAAMGGARTPGWVWVAAVVPSLLALATAWPWATGGTWPGPSLIVLGVA